MELDRRKEAPSLYIQIAQQMAKKIEEGEFTTGELIPSERELQDKYQVSRMTIRQAMRELTNRNYIECRRGIGTVVIYGKIQENIKHVVSLTEEMEKQGVHLKTVLCTLKQGTLPEQAAEAMEKADSEHCFILTRVRSVKGKPLVYSVTYLCLEDLPTEVSLYQHSMYSLLKEQKNVIITHGKDILEAGIAKSDVAEMLSIPVGDPVFKRTRVTYDQNNHSVEYSVCYYPGDQYKCSVEL